MFTQLYLTTTDPNKSLSELLRENIGSILASVIFHTVVYAAAFNLASFIFLGRVLSSAVNSRLILSLLFIMFFGYMARYYHVQEIYKTYGENKAKAKEHVDKLFIGWIFIG
jgi:type III secretory pathway component EscU